MTPSTDPALRAADIALPGGLLPENASVLVALSGGADSVCLLDLLCCRGDLTVKAAHYEHGLRGEESLRDMAFVRELCREKNVPLYIEQGDVAAEAAARGRGVEETARELRYAFLFRTAEEANCGFIATAHNLGDNAETVLLRLARGTGLKGLGGIPPKRGNIVRPLLQVSRRQIEAYLTARNLPHVEDSSNHTDEYARNRVRHHVLPALEEVHPGAAESIARTAALLREDEAFLESLAVEFLAGQEENALSSAALLALPKPIARRALRLRAGRDLSAEHVQALLELCTLGPSAELHLPGLTARREYDRLLFGAARAAVPEERELRPGTTLRVCAAQNDKEWEIVISDLYPAGEREEIKNSLNIFSISYGNICGTLRLGPRREGEHILLQGRAGTRSVKKLLSDAKIPRAERDFLPLLRDDEGPLAIYGFGRAERAVPRAGEACLRVTVKLIQREETDRA